MDTETMVVESNTKYSKPWKGKEVIMMNIFPRNSLVIHRAINGFIVNIKGTIEQQEDGFDGIHVFEDIEKLNKFIKTHYEESNK